MNSHGNLVIAGVILLLAAAAYGGYTLFFKPNPEEDAKEVAGAYCDCAEKNSEHYKSKFRDLQRMFDSEIVTKEKVIKELDELETGIKRLSRNCHRQVSSQRARITEHLGDKQFKIFDDVYRKKTASCDESVDEESSELRWKIERSKALLARDLIGIPEPDSIEHPIQISEDDLATDDPDKVYIQVEQMPEFPGGQTALLKYLSGIPYPPIANENDIQGSVFVKFVVDKNGKVSNVEAAKAADKILTDAALAHVRNMPAWKPGKQSGKPVRVQFIVPIKFVLN